MGKFLKGLKEKADEIKKRFGKKSQVALAGILAIIMLIIFFKGINASPSKSAEVGKTSSPTNENNDYVSKLEIRLEKIIGSIKGVGEVNVFVMTETSVKTIYASNEERKTSVDDSGQTNSESVEIVFNKNGSETTPIVSVEIYPEVVGVLVVASGVNDEKLRLLVTNAVSVALNIENSKIEVLTGEKA